MTEAPQKKARKTAPGTAFDGKAYVAGLSTSPGVYRMYAADDGVLYVGKAGALKKRVASYFSATPKPARTMAMPLPETSGLGSSMPYTKRAIPASIKACEQGPVLPVWLQGSRLT